MGARTIVLTSRHKCLPIAHVRRASAFNVLPVFDYEIGDALAFQS